MENKGSRDTSGSDAGGCGTARDGSESVSGVTEVGSSGNAAAEKARWHGRGSGKGGLSMVTATDGEELGDDSDRGSEERTAAGYSAASSPVRLAAARLGWLLLGFAAGAAAAAAMLLLKFGRHPETCTVPT